MKAAYIASALGEARREGRAWRCLCPLHGGHSLVIRNGDRGRVLVTCWAGCNRSDVLAELRARGLLGGWASDHQPRTTAASRDDETRRIALARRIWDAATDARGSPVERYLAGRGLTIVPPAALRWSPRCWHREARAYLPAMVARVEHVARGLVGVHRTFLTSDYRRRERASLGPIAGAAVRLGTPRPGEWLALTEGIETALAVMTACAMSAWAALSAGGLRVLLLPHEATHVIICADHDASGTGERAAHDAAARWLAEGRRVRIAIPPRSGTDFNDVLSGRAAANIIEARHVA
jgi:putative DNA primase/helicase